MGSSGTPAPSDQQLNQKYNLRWHDYPQSVVTSFRHLKEDEDFVDVTLACNSQQFTAHKVVLSACSPYFKKLLKVRFFILSIKNSRARHSVFQGLKIVHSQKSKNLS
jgi:hypothetical protein